MKTKIITILLAVMFLPVSQVQADLFFYSDTVIQEGDYYDTVVNVYDTPPDHTTVDMTGGFVHYLRSYDSSIINMNGGEILTLETFNTSTANISGGDVRSVFTWDNATTNLYDGGSVFSLGAGVSGTINMMGGTTEYLHAGGSCTFNLYGGIVKDSINAWDSATINIYGYGFDYDPSAGKHNGGLLTGFWFDDTTFTIDLYDPVTYDHINLVPEPSSLILFALVCLFLRRKK